MVYISVISPLILTVIIAVTKPSTPPFQPLVEKSRTINKIDHLDPPPGRIVVIINSIKYTIQTLPLDEETKNLIIQYNRPFSPLSLVEES